VLSIFQDLSNNLKRENFEQGLVPHSLSFRQMPYATKEGLEGGAWCWLKPSLRTSLLTTLHLVQ